MRAWGEMLVAALASATRSVVIAAPFIKEAILFRVLAQVPSQATVVVYTRWRPDEVASGVSDLAVLDVIRARHGSSLFLCPSLHAKYYRHDGWAWIGSANLTGAALGWSQHPNLELLHRAPWPSSDFEAFETALRQSSIPATEDIRQQVALAAALLPAPATEHVQDAPPADPGPFLPRTRHPEQLLLMYSGRADDLTVAARSQAGADLAALAAPRGLSSEAFRAFVSAELLQSQIISRVDNLVASPRRFGEIRALLARHLHQLGSDRDPAEALQTLVRWLLFFLPNRYELATPNYSEVLLRK
jgi:hypothetical protein